MRDYVFILDNETESKKIVIEAAGMMDAFTKAKKEQEKTSRQKKAKVSLLFQGIVYS